MRWLEAEAPFPAGQQRALTWLLTALLVLFCYLAWCSDFSWLRDRGAVAIRWTGIAIGVWRVGLIVLRGPANPRGARQDGGIPFALVVALMSGWWTASSLLAGTTDTGDPTEDRTLTTQAALGAAAVLLLVTRKGGAVRIQAYGPRWIASYLLFLVAMLMMIADTDYQRWDAETIDWDLWIRWRCLNYALIVPYLMAGIAVVQGVRLAVVCYVGIAAIVLLAVLLACTGVQM